MKILLFAFAHREDETVVRSTIAIYKTMGWRIDRVFATDFGYARGTLSSLTPGTLEDFFYRSMERILPTIVITFDTTGMNNDPDHRKVSYAATFAFQRYASWLAQVQTTSSIHASYDTRWFRQLESLLTEGCEPKLYYVCTPQSTVAQAVRRGELPHESFGAPWRGVSDEKITAVIDGEHFVLRMEGTKEYLMGKNDRIRDRL